MSRQFRPGLESGNYGNMLIGDNRRPDNKESLILEDDDSTQGHEQLSVLIVDDHVDFLNSMRDLLEWSDYRVYVAEDTENAEKATREYMPDIALVDVKLGTESGLELVPELKKLNPGMPCIVMTAYRGQKYALNAFQSGADEFLYKPFNPENLFRVMNGLLGRDESE
jgi:DNA-binding NtrC family response regulator